MKQYVKRSLAYILAAVMIATILPNNAFAIDGEDIPEQPELICICTEKCADGQVNENCPVCVNDLTACTGAPAQNQAGGDDEQGSEQFNQPSEGDTGSNQPTPQPPASQPNNSPEGDNAGDASGNGPDPGSTQGENQGSQELKDFLDLAEQLPKEITAENAEEYQDLLDDCAQAWEALSETEQEREDVQKAYAQLNTLRDQLNAAQISLLSDTSYLVSDEESLKQAITAINADADVESAVIELQNDIDVTSVLTISKNITIKSAEGKKFRITREADKTSGAISIKASSNNLYQDSGDEITEVDDNITTPQATYNLFNLTANTGELTLDSVILDGATAPNAWYIAKPENGDTWTGERKDKIPYYSNSGNDASPWVIYKDQNGNEIPYAYEAVITNMEGIVVSTKPMIQANSGTKVTLQNGTKVENIFANCDGAIISTKGTKVVLQDTEVTSCASSKSSLVVGLTNSSIVDVLGDTHIHGNVTFSSSNHALFYVQSSSELTFGTPEGTDNIIIEDNIYHGNGLIGSYNRTNPNDYASITINSGEYRNNRWSTFIVSNAWGCIVYVYDYVEFTMNGGSIEDNYCGISAIATHEYENLEGGPDSDDLWKIKLNNGTIKNNVSYYCYNPEMDKGMGAQVASIAFAQQNASTYISENMDIEGDLLLLGGRVKNDAEVQGNVTVGERGAQPALVVGNGSFTGAGHYDIAGWIGTIVMSGNSVDLSDDSTDGYYVSNWGVAYIQPNQCLVLMKDGYPVSLTNGVEIAPNGHSFKVSGQTYNNVEEFKDANPGNTTVFRNTFEFFPNFERITVDTEEGVRNLQRNIVLTGTAEDKLALPACDWYRDNYDFDGWFYKGKLYKSGTAVQADEDKDFQAIWETATLHPYALTVYADGTFSGEWYVKAEGADKNGEVEAKYRKIEPSDVKVNGVSCTTEFPFELVKVDTRVPGVHEYKIQPKEAYKESMITVRGNENVNDALILFDQSQELTIRDTTADPATEAVSYTQTSPESKLQADQVQAYLPADTEMLTNDIAGWKVEDKDSIVLLNDEILSQDRKNLLKTTADTLAKDEGWYDPDEDNRKYDFRYLDLMNPDHANAWVTSTKGATIFWGYPSGTNQNTEFTLVSFKNLNREDGTGFTTTTEDAVNQNLKEFERIPCSNTEYGLTFELDSDEFGPFMLTWVANDSGGAYHPEYNPDDKDTDEPEEEPEEIDEEEVPLAETPWLNTEDHYAYIIGYAEDGTVRPQANITRAEVATIFFRLLTDEARDEFWSTSNNFSDVAPDAWYNNAVSTMVNAGIIQGYEDGTFRPNNNITRAEFAAIASRFMSSGYDVEEDLFTDIANHWARQNINDAAMTQWINGYPDGTFLPDKAITRAEAVTLVNNVLQRKPDADHLLDSMIKWPDNPESAWYYEAIQEATNSHDYDLFEGAEYEIWTSLLENRDWAALEKDWVNAHRTGGEVM